MPWWMCTTAERRYRRYWRFRIPHHVCGVAHVSSKCPSRDQWQTEEQAFEQLCRLFNIK